MKICFDISQTGRNKAGGGYLAYSLIRALAEIDRKNQYLQYPTFGDFYFDPDWKKTISLVRQENFKKGFSQSNLEEAKQFWNSPESDFEYLLGNPDIIHSNNYYCPVGLSKAKLVYTLYDLIFLEAPEYTTEANRIGCFDGVFRASLFADHIISISEYSKSHFLATFPYYPQEKITVVPLASRYVADISQPIERPSSLSFLESDQFLFNLGTLEPRKNQIGLLHAYTILQGELKNTFPLVIGGGKGWLLDGFEDQIMKLGLQDKVFLLGYVDDNQLQWLYRNCFAFIWPSFFEGFGLPVLEAMSQGAAVITSNTTSLPEVVGDSGILIDPEDVDAIASAMFNLISDNQERQRIKAMALNRSAEFTWERVAKKINTLYANIN